MGQTGHPETSVQSYQHTVHINPEEQGPHTELCYMKHLFAFVRSWVVIKVLMKIPVLRDTVSHRSMYICTDVLEELTASVFRVVLEQ